MCGRTRGRMLIRKGDNIAKRVKGDWIICSICCKLFLISPLQIEIALKEA
nr:MAG TPA: hypothetical protein [Caudoviricetes sp.]